ncbi:MAG: FMN-binding protein [Spirochaetaceae bacterium]|jgi:electron transport complex protein RnfG|nr:FMN-binding protein [Spirochaetaceae bacterium]
MKDMLKLGVILACFATAACVGLALVYKITEEIIAQRSQADLETALKDLFPSADAFSDITGEIPSPYDTVSFGSQYAIKQGDALLGTAIRASGPSYGGLITVLVGVGSDGRITGVKILEHQDTPGLGANAASPSYYVDKTAKLTFYGQFAGKPVSDPFEAKEDVAAVTASTITSRAVASVVKASGTAAAAWMNVQGGIQ